MGINKGFDLFPPLGTSKRDQLAYQRFLEEVKRVYRHDSKVGVRAFPGSGAQYLSFDVGEEPSLPCDYTVFRRFSSKISGLCADAEKYIDKVASIAQRHFGPRVVEWHEYSDEDPPYSWTEVYHPTPPCASCGAGRYTEDRSVLVQLPSPDWWNQESVWHKDTTETLRRERNMVCPDCLREQLRLVGRIVIQEKLPHTVGKSMAQDIGSYVGTL